jgi:hypothetical protein
MRRIYRLVCASGHDRGAEVRTNSKVWEIETEGAQNSSRKSPFVLILLVNPAGDARDPASLRARGFSGQANAAVSRTNSANLDRVILTVGNSSSILGVSLRARSMPGRI